MVDMLTRPEKPATTAPQDEVEWVGVREVCELTGMPEQDVVDELARAIDYSYLAKCPLTVYDRAGREVALDKRDDRAIVVKRDALAAYLKQCHASRFLILRRALAAF